MNAMTPATDLLDAANALQETAAQARAALTRGDYLAYSAKVTEAVARFGTLHRAYRAFIDSRKRYQP